MEAKRITTLQELEQYAKQGKAVYTVCWGGCYRPATWFMSMQARTLLGVMNAGIFEYVRKTPLRKAILMSVDDDALIYDYMNRYGFKIGEEYEVSATQNTDDGMSYKLIGPKGVAWVLYNQIKFIKNGSDRVQGIPDQAGQKG